MHSALVCIAFLALAVSTSAAMPNVDDILASGNFADGIVALNAQLQEQPQDDNARFGLGLVQFAQAVQRLGQRLAAYEFQTYDITELKDILPVATVPAEPLTYPTLRQILQDWLDGLTQVDATLAKIANDETKVAIRVGRISLNLGSRPIRLKALTPTINKLGFGVRISDEDLAIAFDRADVDLLRSGCHCLLALGEIGMAHDAQSLFDVSAHLFFKHVKTPHAFLLEQHHHTNDKFSFDPFLDLLAFVHMLRLPVIEPKRMEVALGHLEQVLTLNRQMWQRILAETDDDREWIPNPRQTSAVKVDLDQEMIDNWLRVLTKIEPILQGQKLIPFWRGKPTRGINLRRVFLNPIQLDLVLWIQGTAATPYLEEGDLAEPELLLQFGEGFAGQSQWFLGGFSELP